METQAFVKKFGDTVCPTWALDNVGRTKMALAGLRTLPSDFDLGFAMVLVGIPTRESCKHCDREP